MKLVILCCVLSLVVLNGCVRLSGAAGCWKTTSEGETTSKEVGFDTGLGTQPIISYVKEFLTIVPMVLTIWPALFAGFHLLANRKDGAKKTSAIPERKEKENV